jgi:cytochrome P450
MFSQETFDVNSQAFYRNSNEIFKQSRESEPIFRRMGAYGAPIWYVTRYADVDAVLRDPDHFSVDYRQAVDADRNRPVGSSQPGLMDMVNNHLLTIEGQDHARLRGLVSKAFTPKMISGLRERIQTIADTLLDAVEGQSEIDLVETYAFPLPIQVIAEMLGIPAEDREKFREWSDAFVTTPFTGADDSAFIQSAMGFVSYLSEIFDQRRKDPRSDLISALLQAEENGDRLRIDELYSMVVLLIIAGHETTVTLIGNAMVALLTHPETLARLQAHPEEMSQAVEEFLRFEAPVQRSIGRWVTADIELGGKTMKRGEMVIAVLGSANRDDAVFKNADALNMDRENNPHMAFGKGVHYCLGAPLARLEAEIALNTLLRRFPDLALAVPFEDLQYRQTPLFHAFERIPIRLSANEPERR